MIYEIDYIGHNSQFPSPTLSFHLDYKHVSILTAMCGGSGHAETTETAMPCLLCFPAGTSPPRSAKTVRFSIMRSTEFAESTHFSTSALMLLSDIAAGTSSRRNTFWAKSSWLFCEIKATENLSFEPKPFGRDFFSNFTIMLESDATQCSETVKADTEQLWVIRFNAIYFNPALNPRKIGFEDSRPSKV